MREVNIREFLENFVAISYFQESRLFRYSDIYEYICRCYKNGSEEYQEKVDVNDLHKESGRVLHEMVEDGTLTNLEGKSGFNALFRVNDKIKYVNLAKYDNDYLLCMNRVFLDIHGGEKEFLALTPTNAAQKK